MTSSLIRSQENQTLEQAILKCHPVEDALGVTGVKAEKDLWDWFIRHEPRLFSFRSDEEDERERVFDELATEMSIVRKSYRSGANLL